MRFRNALSIIDLSPCRVQGDVMDGMDGIDGMLLIKAFSQSFILGCPDHWLWQLTDDNDEGGATKNAKSNQIKIEHDLGWESLVSVSKFWGSSNVALKWLASLRLNLLGFLVSIFKFYGCVHPTCLWKCFLWDYLVSIWGLWVCSVYIQCISKDVSFEYFVWDSLVSIFTFPAGQIAASLSISIRQPLLYWDFISALIKSGWR